MLSQLAGLMERMIFFVLLILVLAYSGSFLLDDFLGVAYITEGGLWCLSYCWRIVVLSGYMIFLVSLIFTVGGLWFFLAIWFSWCRLSYCWWIVVLSGCGFHGRGVYLVKPRQLICRGIRTPEVTSTPTMSAYMCILSSKVGDRQSLCLVVAICLQVLFSKCLFKFACI